MTYRPNFRRRDVRQRAQRALDWAQAYLSTTKPRPWAKSQIEQHFGHGSDPLPQWLRQQLLVVANDRYNMHTGQCKQYLLNAAGAQQLAQEIATERGAATLRPLTQVAAEQALLRNLVSAFLGIEPDNIDNNIITTTTSTTRLHSVRLQENIVPEMDKNTTPTTRLHSVRLQENIVPEMDKNTTPTTRLHSVRLQENIVPANVEQVAKNLSQEFSSELASRDFKYIDKSHRLWHPLQSIRREYRTEILAQSGLTYDWDIECAAPTLLLQHARRAGGLTLPTPTIDALIADRSWFRTELAADTDISPDQAKQVVNALFCGAKIGFNPEFSSIARYLDSDREKLWLLRSSPLLQALRSEIKLLWASLAWTLPRREITDSLGRRRLLPISPRQKWAVYFTQERRVLDAVRKYLELTDNPVFLIHDGWVTRDEIILTEIQDYITLMTGYTVNIEEKNSHAV